MVPVTDPDLELGGGGLDFLALLALFPSVISSFLPKIRGGRPPRAPPLYPPLGSRVDSHGQFIFGKLEFVSRQHEIQNKTEGKV